MLNSVITLILLTSSLGFVAGPLLVPDYSDFALSSQAPVLSRDMVNRELNCKRQLMFLQGGKQVFTVKTL